MGVTKYSKGNECRVRVKCQYLDNNGNGESFAGPLIILANGCERGSPVGYPAIAAKVCTTPENTVNIGGPLLTNGAIVPVFAGPPSAFIAQ